MGCCFTYCCGRNNSQDEDPDVHTRLLSDPVCNTSAIPCTHSDDLSAEYDNSLPKKANEQSVLNKILQTTAQNVIDVAALGPPNMEQNEYLERRNQYSSKLNHLAGAVAVRQPTSSHGILIDVPSPEKILSAPPISESDYVLIKKASLRFKSALTELKVKQTQDLIVPFHIGTV